MRIRSLLHRGRSVGSLAGMLVMVALLVPAVSAGEPPTGTPDASRTAGIPGSLVVGAGTTTLGEGFPAEFFGDRIFVALDAFALPDQAARGSFTITHRKPNGELFADLHGEINCLAVDGGHAVVTGTITAARTPGLPNGDVHEGMLAAIVVQDGGDSDHMAWTFGDPALVPDCAELPAVTTAPLVEQGNFVVLHE